MHCEYDLKDLAEPIMQGDLIQATGDVSSWERYGVIVTGDCDIDKNKTKGILSYCQIIELEKYFYDFFILDRINTAYEKYIQQAKGLVNSLVKKTNQNFTEFSDAIFRVWITSSSKADILRLLNTIPLELDKLIEAIKLLSNISSPTKEVYLDSIKIMKGTCFDRLAEEKKIFDDFSTKIKNLPGDWFFLNSLPGVASSGFVIYLRQIREVPKDEIAIRPFEENLRRYKRIGKIKAPYIYRITQMLATVFSDIGLPSNYETERHLSLCSFIEIGRK